MAQEAKVPATFWATVQKKIDDSISKFARSGFLRNASISDGGLTIKGGFLRLLDKVLGVELFYVGPVTPNKADGTPQQGWVVRRADGTTVLALFDAFPTDAGGQLQQALNWLDRSEVVAVADDTNSGQGLARPYVPIPLTRSRYTDMVAVTDATFVDVFDSAPFYKVNARALATIRCTTDDSATMGEVRVLVDQVQVGDTVSVGFAVAINTVGAFVVPGDAYSLHQVKVQARRTAGTGAVRLDSSVWGVQT